MRGEHAEASRTMRSKVGSSPHARGALHVPFGKLSRPGIIPACAGSTELRDVRAGGVGDHPRMRGEHDGSPSVTWDGTGSSPHARGALPGPRAKVRDDGIIPACAGSTSAP